MKWLVILLLPAVLLGCSVNEDYVKADEETYDVVAPEYLLLVDGAYKLDGVDADGNPKYVPWFTNDQKERRKRLVQTWKLRIDKNK